MKKKRIVKKGTAIGYKYFLLIITVLFIFSTVRFLVQRQQLINKKAELTAAIEEEKNKQQFYLEELARVGTDEYYEYMARKNLGYIYPDEKILIVTETPNEPSEEITD